MRKDFYTDSELLNEKYRIWSLWSLNDRLHRDEGPAVYSYLNKYSYNWYKFGKIHRKYQPAIINSSLAKNNMFLNNSKCRTYMKYELDLLSTGKVDYCRFIDDDEYAYYENSRSARYLIEIYYCKWFMDDKDITPIVFDMMQKGKLNFNYLDWTKKEKALFDLRF